jgi:hypothetical protein
MHAVNLATKWIAMSPPPSPGTGWTAAEAAARLAKIRQTAQLA